MILRFSDLHSKPNETINEVLGFAGVNDTSIDEDYIIPFGKARYRSGRTGKTELIGVKLSIGTNSNGHIAYEALWEDGYKSSYVFWRTGRAEIFSKNKAGFMERTNARFKQASNGDCIITADTNAVTTFPSFTPTLN